MGDQKSDESLKAEAGSFPTSSHDGLTHLITGHKLNGQNYNQWVRSVTIFLQGKGREGYITGDSKCPEKGDTNLQKWQLENSQVMTWLLNTMTNEIGENFMFYDTAKDIWDAVKETYSDVDNTSAVFEIKSILHDLRQGESSVTEYFNILNRHWQQLDIYEEVKWCCTEDQKKYKDLVGKERIYKFLLGLNKDLDEVRGRILGTKPLPKIREAFSEVRREESRRKLMLGTSISAPSTESSAMAARGNQPQPPTKKTRPWCDQCKRPGHTKENCWSIYGKPPEAKQFKSKEGRGNTVVHHQNSEVISNSSPFSKEQMETLQKLLQQTMLTAGKSGTAAVAQKGNFLYALNTSKGKIESWIIDSGASDHMTGDLTLFSSYSPCPYNYTVRIADGTHSKVMGKGSVIISPHITLESVLYVPELDCNLLSISKITRDLKCVAKFSDNLCEFQILESGKTIGNAKECAGLYLLKVEKSEELKTHSYAVATVPSSENDVMLWHYRLGHPNFMYLEKIFPSLFNKNQKNFQCETCQLSKHTRSHYPPQPYKPSQPFSLIHSDVWGPSRVHNITGSRWFVTFIDDHTRVTWVFLMKEKSEVGKIFEVFHNMVQTQFQSKIQILRTDNGREYYNLALTSYLQKVGIVHQSSCVDTPQQNGVAERKNRHLLEVTRSIMSATNVPKQFWGEAVLSATYLINRMPSRILDFKTPLSTLQTTFPASKILSSIPLKVFGCSAFVHNLNPHRSKLDPRSIKCIFLGYSPHQKGYRCYSPITKKFYHTMDVTFFENQAYYTKVGIQGEQSYRYPTETLEYQSLGLEQTEPAQTLPTQASSQPAETTPKPIERTAEVVAETENDGVEVLTSSQQNQDPKVQGGNLKTYERKRRKEVESSTTPTQNHESNQALENEVPTGNVVPNSVPVNMNAPDTDIPIAMRKGVRTCTQHPIERYVSYGKLSQKYRSFVAAVDNIEIPKNIQEALQKPEWAAAVTEEVQALVKNGTWEITTIPEGKRPVGCKWIFSVKYNADGSINRYKARLVAKGFTQSYGVDYEETFAPVAKLNSVRVLLSLAANLDWPLHQLDIKNAFLNGELEEEVYMQIPPGLESPNTSNMVCRLRKSLYGLKQSPRAWFDRLTRVVKEDGFVQCQTDHTMFAKHSMDGKIALFIVYVDDIVITGDDYDQIKHLKSLLANEFEVKDLGQLKYFLGMEIARTKNGIYVSQRKYTLDLLKETGMLGCKAANTPIEPVKRSEEESIPADKDRYQSLVGKLIYLTHTRPDIGFAVSLASRYMSNPTETHMKTVNRILQYLKGSPGRGLYFQKNSNRGIEVYTDSDWAGCLSDRKSTTGYCTFVWGNMVTWRSKKQSVVARSSAEAEFRAMAQGICEGIWLKRMLDEIRIPTNYTMRILCDNKAAISIAKNPVHHDRTKHVEIDRHFIKEKIDQEIIRVDHIPSCKQTADIMTKALPRNIYENIRSNLGMIDIFHPD